jgi:hypothetical protein
MCLGTSLTARAQLSLYTGGGFTSRSESPAIRNEMLGLDEKIGFDVGKKWQLDLTGRFNKPIGWKHIQDMNLVYLNYTGNVPIPLQSNVHLKLNEFGFLTTRFLLGTNISTAGIYISAGPGMSFYTAEYEDKEGKDGPLTQKATDIVLDSRIGGQVNIAIGWLYAEGRFAPKIYSSDQQNTDYFQHNSSPLTGFNVGLRFLLTRHMDCQ